jgi:D-amino-acid dehydrogenase
VEGLGPSADVVVVGGGAIGLICALELRAAGRQVVVLESGTFTEGTSHGNAGLLCPSYVTPIASPKVLATSLAWLVRGEGPLTLSRPPWRGDMARWIARFLRSCASTRRAAATRLLADLASRSIEWYAEFAARAPAFGLARNGWLYVYATAAGLREGLDHARTMKAAGVAARVLGGDEAVSLEPSLVRPVGAIEYPGDAHLDPHAFVASAASCASEEGIALRPGIRVSELLPEDRGVRVVTSAGEIRASGVVVAAGASTPHVARRVTDVLPILPARGHSMSLQMRQRPRRPLLFAEAHLVLTPMPGRVRITSGLELGSSDPQPDMGRVETMLLEATRYLADGKPGCTDPWVGFRPLTPDGLPIVGRLSACPQIIIASGHGTLGMTLAPATAQIVRACLEGAPLPAMLSPNRFGA